MGQLSKLLKTLLSQVRIVIGAALNHILPQAVEGIGGFAALSTKSRRCLSWKPNVLVADSEIALFGAEGAGFGSVFTSDIC